MDLATLIGLIGLIGVWALMIVTIMMGGAAHMFVNVSSLLIAVVGTMLVVMMKFGMSQYFGALKAASKVFPDKLGKPADLISEIVELAAAAIKGRLRCLSGKKVGNDFLHSGTHFNSF
jgi:chemotaxis protein MotA